MLNDRITQLNLRSLHYKFDEFVGYNDSKLKKPLVICLSEVWIDEDFEKDLNKLPENSSMTFEQRKCRNDGVAIFIHKTITFDQEQLNSTLNIAAECVTCKQVTFKIFCLYKVPS